MQRNALTVLFLGDSITASTRNLNDGNDLGGGYPKYAAERICARFPDTQFTFFNRGIWGNETKDMLLRLQTDAVDLQPDIIVLFVGVNDTLRHAFVNDLPMEQFAKQYGEILTTLKEKTKAKILTVEPYLLMQDQYDRAAKRFDLIARIDCIRKLTKGVIDGYMPLDGLFASLYVTDNAESYTADGLHPNEKGAMFIGVHCAEYLAPIIENVLSEDNL